VISLCEFASERVFSGELVGRGSGCRPFIEGFGTSTVLTKQFLFLGANLALFRDSK
jgi:hypothetical protein